MHRPAAHTRSERACAVRQQDEAGREQVAAALKRQLAERLAEPGPDPERGAQDFVDAMIEMQMVRAPSWNPTGTRVIWLIGLRSLVS